MDHDKAAGLLLLAEGASVASFRMSSMTFQGTALSSKSRIARLFSKSSEKSHQRFLLSVL
jgi:hypothetical protein